MQALSFNMLTRDFCLTLLKESEGIITQHSGPYMLG